MRPAVDVDEPATHHEEIRKRRENHNLLYRYPHPGPRGKQNSGRLLLP